MSFSLFLTKKTKISWFFENKSIIGTYSKSKIELFTIFDRKPENFLIFWIWINRKEESLGHTQGQKRFFHNFPQKRNKHFAIFCLNFWILIKWKGRPMEHTQGQKLNFSQQSKGVNTFGTPCIHQNVQFPAIFFMVICKLFN